MTVLVIAEHDNASIKSATLNTVTAAVACGGDVHVLVAGHNATEAAKAAALVAGVAKVLHADEAGDLRGGLGGFGGVVAGHQHVHVATDGDGGGDGVQGGALDGGVVVFSDDEGGHVLFSPWIR